MKIKDLWNDCTPILDGITFKADWVDEYKKEYLILDRFFVQNWGAREILANTPAEFRLFAEATLYANKYRLDKLYETLSYVYDPLYNVEEIVDETINNDNSILDDATQGKKERVVDIKYDSVVNRTDVKTGDSNQNVEYGSHSDNLTDSVTTNVAPFNNSSQHPKNWEDGNHINQYGAQIVHTDTSSRHDVGTTSTDNREDWQTITDQPNTLNNTRTEDLKQILHRERKGNIGIRSAQELIEQERRIALYNFWEDFFKTVVADCCCHVVSDINPRLEEFI